MTDDAYIPEHLFSWDHWSTLGYIETRMVDYHGYWICCDARMRTDAHNLRIFMHRPERWRVLNKYGIAQMGRVGSKPIDQTEHPEIGMLLFGGETPPTRLADGTTVVRHDDWDCIQDLSRAGYLVGDARRYPLRGMQFGKRLTKEARAEITKLMLENTDQLGVDLGARIRLTPRGLEVSAALRAHRARGGSTANFRAPPTRLGGTHGTRAEKVPIRSEV